MLLNMAYRLSKTKMSREMSETMYIRIFTNFYTFLLILLLILPFEKKETKIKTYFMWRDGGEGSDIPLTT